MLGAGSLTPCIFGEQTKEAFGVITRFKILLDKCQNSWYTIFSIKKGEIKCTS